MVYIYTLNSRDILYTKKSAAEACSMCSSTSDKEVDIQLISLPYGG